MGRDLRILALLSVAWLASAVGLKQRVASVSKPEQDLTTAREVQGQLGSSGRVNGSWYMCAAPVVATRAGPGTKIPLILHQTYKSKVSLPEFFVKCHNSWVEQTPTWKHRVWLDHENRNLVKVHYPWFLDTYDSYEHTIQRVDAARVFMLHRYGGVYADMDIEAVRDPAPLFNGGHDLVFFYQLPPHGTGTVIDDVNGPKLGTISNAFMASKPGHPFWIFLANMMMDKRKDALLEADTSGIAYMDIYLTTGPSILTHALSAYQREYPQTRVAIFSKKYWSPFQWGQKEDPCEVHWECRALYPEAFVISHWTRSWVFCDPNNPASKTKRVCQTPTTLLQLGSTVESDLDLKAYAAAGDGSWCP